MGTTITPPDLGSLLAPILPALPAAAVSTEPATGILPFLSPILRQRVQLLSSSSTEGWLRLLCYDTSKAAKLADLVGGGSLEPHPVSGEVEVDWDYDSQTKYRRLDDETLQALVVLSDLGLAFQLIYCVGDAEGGGDGWRVGEVTVAEKPSPFAQFGGAPSIGEAEAQHKESQTSKQQPAQTNGQHKTSAVVPDDVDDDDDGGYWDQYDATPAQTPGAEQSKFPPPDSSVSQGGYRPPSADDDYYARYDSVQPAMDNHDPDEAAQQAHFAPPPLGLGAAAPPPAALSTAAVETHNKILSTSARDEEEDEDARRRRVAGIVHPRPESSASSKGSNTVARLEATAGKQEQNEFGVKQHISRSIRSLYMLSRASGIEREEFERLVKTELDVLGMAEEEDEASN